MAERLDLTGLIEAIRKDKYGFSLRDPPSQEGTETPEGVLIKLVQKWNNLSENARPPESLFKKTVLMVVDRMLELQFWDELSRVEEKVTCPDYLKEKLKTFKIALQVSPLMKNQKQQLYEVFTRENEVSSVAELKGQIRGLRATPSTRETVCGLLDLSKEERGVIIQLINPEEEEAAFDLDENTCEICYALPKTHKMQCNHLVCENCYKGFKRNGNRCPFCRGEIG